MSPWLSVIIPVYNTKSYLRRCLDSVVMQNCLAPYEVVLVDDGSTDGSSEICDEYAAAYPNFHIIHEKNSGVSAARNVALDASLGDYIWFVDSDDRLLPGAMRRVEDLCVSRPQAVIFSAIQEGDGGNKLGLIPAPNKGDFASRGPLECRDPLYPFTHVLRRDLIGSTRFDTRLALMEDRDFLYRILVRAGNGVIVVDEPLYGYLVTRQDSATNSHGVESIIGAANVQFRILRSELELGRREPAYQYFAETTLSALGCIARSGGYRDEFEVLRKRLLRYERFSRDLSGSTSAKYQLCRLLPRFYRLAYRMDTVLKKDGDSE
jgi:glycosyltransferase involved in cell wall biosynthesis